MALGIRKLVVLVLVAAVFLLANVWLVVNWLEKMGAVIYVSSLVAISLCRELSPVLTALVVAGRVGSAIAAELGTMKVTEQIDSMEIMGINSASYLILPKVIAVVFISPMLFILSVTFGLLGGLIAGPVAGAVTISQYLDGMTYLFIPFYVKFGIIKSLVFGFLIASVPAYLGYYVEGGALEVGRASTKSVVNTSVLILFFDLILTQLFFK